jgi:hypothetical protein
MPRQNRVTPFGKVIATPERAPPSGTAASFTTLKAASRGSDRCSGDYSSYPLADEPAFVYGSGGLWTSRTSVRLDEGLGGSWGSSFAIPPPGIGDEGSYP